MLRIDGTCSYFDLLTNFGLYLSHPFYIFQQLPFSRYISHSMICNVVDMNYFSFTVH